MATIKDRHAEVGKAEGSAADAKATYAVLRSKRQITLPKEVCEKLGIQSGDRLELAVEGDMLIARPSKALALEALQAIQEAFQRSGITEEDLLEEGRKIRKQLARERYGLDA